MRLVEALTSLARESAKRKPSPVRKMANIPSPYIYECKPCGEELEGPSHNYPTSVVCPSCAGWVDAQENPLRAAYLRGRADYANEHGLFAPGISNV